MNGAFYDFTTQIDRAFLERVREGFGDTSFPMEMMVFVLALLGLAVIVLYLGNLFQKYSHKLFGKKPATGEIVKPSEVEAILVQVLDERIKLEMQFAPATPSRKSIGCTLMDLDQETMLLELPHSVRPSRAWLEREILCYLRVPDKKDHFIHYAFTSSIAGVRRLPGDLVQLRVLRPSRLMLHQKRASLRILPPSHYVLGVAMWCGSYATNPKRINFIRSWGKPDFRYAPSNNIRSLKLEDISAGGVKLLVPKEHLRGAKQYLTLRSTVILLLELFDPDAKKRRIFWLQGMIKNSYEDFTTKNLELGIQFTRSGSIIDSKTHKLEWSTIEPEGIETIASWVMKRHLEMYRRTGAI